MKSIKMFNFKENWNLVEPHLNEPEVLALLDKGMSEYAASKSDDNLPQWDIENGIGPWAYARTDLLLERCNNNHGDSFSIRMHHQYKCNLIVTVNEVPLSLNPQNDQKLSELVSQYQSILYKAIDHNCKQLDAYIYYQCLGADRELAQWQKALAEKVFPDYKWKVLQTDSSCDEGYPIIGNRTDGSLLVFDIFSFDRYSAMEVLKSAGILKPKLVA